MLDKKRKKLKVMKHDNNRTLAIIYESINPKRRGPIVTFNLMRHDGSAVGHSEVGTVLRLCDVAVRVGCFCNVGACQYYLKTTENDFKVMKNAGVN